LEVFLLRRPSADFVREFIANQSPLPFSYSDVGSTATQPPAGYRIDHNRIQLGAGAMTYERAVAALKSWKQFDIGWVRVVPAETVLEKRAVVAVEAKAFGLWSLNAARVVYMIDDAGGLKARFGFAYGTLPDHVEEGEERFTVEWHADDSVWYDIYAFSRPQHPLAQIAQPLVRKLQKQFARDSMAVMASVTHYE
jgi:uncharacterized protein (UPF0548 family)